MNPKKEAKELWTWAWHWAHFATHHLVINRDVVWENPDGTESERERWSRKNKVHILRPRYRGLMKQLPCRCSTRLGRFVLYNIDCDEHGLRARYPRL